MNTLLHEILAAREARFAKQKQLLSEFGVPLVCFTMNIAGPVKDSPLIRRAFDEGAALLSKQLPSIVHQETSYFVTGCEGYFSVAADAKTIKAICTAIEESCPLGRLFDMDVLDIDGTKLERKTERSCLICGKAGRFCAASRSHDVSLLQQTTNEIISSHFAISDANRIADTAVQSLLDEVHITPKPGLVDKNNCGSHTDMDILLFTKSAHALRPYFLRCVQIGQVSSDDCFPMLRQAGMEAEKQMFAATNGVNTHKGAIFTLGILCGAAGRLWKAENPVFSAQQILRKAQILAEPYVMADFSHITEPKTAGERLYQTYGLNGIRGEAAAGFPSVANVSLPVYQQQLAAGKDENDAAAIALMHLIAKVEDTNLYKRGKAEGAAFAHNAAAALLPAPTIAQIKELDKQFIAKNLSPGGCADLLAATLFLHKLSNQGVLSHG